MAMKREDRNALNPARAGLELPLFCISVKFEDAVQTRPVVKQGVR
jgi:hypothetical protein